MSLPLPSLSLPGSLVLGYTHGMKTAVSIPNEVFEEAERLAEQLRTSRSELYSRALAEFLIRHDADRVTEAMNAVIDQIGPQRDPFVRSATRRTLERVEW
jgi:metal-responsive CopG/Arc/MetJ family transcriptional regulator